MFTRITALAAIIGLFAGCAATRPIGDTVSGPAVPISVTSYRTEIPSPPPPGPPEECFSSEGMHYLAKKETQKAYAGYDKGKSDAVKQQYWLYVSLQRQRNRVSNVRLYPVQLPEQHIDGVTFQPTTKYLRIEE